MSEMSTVVSIVVPVYKAELYLNKCVDSICKQSYTNLEIILIDDGSPDKCPEICDMYAQKDSRIKVIHKSNGGVSSARNAGLMIAKGRYICFVDSDDILPQDSIELMLCEMLYNECQFVAGMCGIAESKKVKYKINDKQIIEIQKDSEKLLNYITLSGSYSPYAKMYDLKIIKEKKLQFNTRLKCSEDAVFIRQYLKYCLRMSLIPHIVYYYNSNNENSLSKKGYVEYCEYFVEKIKVLEELLVELPLSECKKSTFLNDRAIHGLRISINHYLQHWKDSVVQKNMINKSVELLWPWLVIENRESKSVYNKWWQKKKRYIEKKQNGKFYWCVKREYLTKRILLVIRMMVKKLIKI